MLHYVTSYHMMPLAYHIMLYDTSIPEDRSAPGGRACCRPFYLLLFVYTYIYIIIYLYYLLMLFILL